ncbi:hypothetical protein AK812_SmicGene15275 [Symbiodinium microadriaticum]|uniref:BTB domain-containing protein n=1 Tax=Symbiodinium microadriaticum TaxID=2951 RepID=A0A1Q9E3F2_SYMMI|nr:hypothetical protein AK812_SmicGene15275 [Symbiodinium microadriaticum]
MHKKPLTSGLPLWEETEDRKVNSELADIVQSVSEAARSAEEMAELSKMVQKASEDLSSVSLTELRSDRFADAEKVSMKALSSATKQLSARLLASKGSQQQALKKLQTRLSSISKDIVSGREVLAKRAKLVEGKELLESEEKRLKSLEEAMASAQAVASLEEVTSGVLDDEKVEELSSVLDNARESLKVSAHVAARRRSTADGPLKAALQSLGERTAKAQSQLNAMLAASKAQRGRIQSAVKMREVKAKAELVEQLLDKVNETELPFLKGMEILPADEVAETVGAAEQAAEELEGAIVDARQFQASAAVDLKASLSADALKSFMKDVTEQSARVNAAAAQLLQFRKAHVARKKAAQRYEAESKVSELEKAVAELEDEAAGLLEGDLPEEELSLRSGEASAKVKSVQDAVAAARQLVFKCQRDGIEDFAAKLKDLQVRISQSNVTLGKAGKTIAGIELKFTAQRTRVEAVKALAEMEEQVERAQAACKPLLEDDAVAVLVDQYQQNVACALWKQMLEKGLGPERLFVEAGAKGGRLDADSLVNFLQAQATPTTKERRASLVARYATEEVSKGKGELVALRSKMQPKRARHRDEMMPRFKFLSTRAMPLLTQMPQEEEHGFDETLREWALMERVTLKFYAESEQDAEETTATPEADHDSVANGEGQTLQQEAASLDSNKKTKREFEVEARFLLSSPAFRSFVRHCQNKTIYLPDDDPDEFEMVLKFMTHARELPEIDPEKLVMLYGWYDKYEIRPLKPYLEKFILQTQIRRKADWDVLLTAHSLDMTDAVEDQVQMFLANEITAATVSYNSDHFNYLYQFVGVCGGSLDLAAFKKLLRRRFAVEHTAPLRSKGTTSQASPGDVFEAYTKVEGAEEVEGCLWPAGISGFLPVVHQGSKCLRQLTGLDAFWHWGDQEGRFSWRRWPRRCYRQQDLCCGCRCMLAERVVQESAESVRASAAKLEEKVKDFPASAKTSTDEVKAEVAKLLPKRQVPVAALSLLQKQMAMAKKNFAKVEAGVWGRGPC